MTTALPATPIDAESPAPPLLRALRWAALGAAVTTLGGCAVWNAVFSDPPPSVPVPTPPAVASEAAPIAPQALPPSSVAASAPAAVASEPVVTPVSVPAPPAATEITPPSPLPKAAAEVPAAKVAPATNVVPSGPGYYINVGLFAVPTNGANAVGILRGAKLPVFHDQVESKTKGKLTRVRVGPYAKKAEADAAAKKIKGLKLDAVVIHQK